jgi:hypothetical protein
MSFELINTSITCQTYINDCLWEFLDLFCVIYINDILIYLNSFEEHIIHVHQVLQCLKEYGLYVKLKKCEFHAQKVIFLRYVISIEGIFMNSSHIEFIVEWLPLKSIHDIQVFLDFANYYQHFIKKYSCVILSIMRLLKKNQKFF